MTADDPAPDDITVHQRGFASIGPHVHTAELPSGRTVRYIDEGEGAPDEPVMVWFGGAGTTARAFRLLEFARELREQLGIRVVSVERNGLGPTPYDPTADHPAQAEDVWALLDRLGIDRVSLMAISGGGPYLAHTAAARPERVRSVHLACAYSEPLDPEGLGRLPFDVSSIAADPASWWRYPEDSQLHRIPGFMAAVLEEALLEGYAQGTPPDLSGLAQAFRLAAEVPLPDLSAVTAPAFLYWGSEDPLVPVGHLERWRSALPNAAGPTVRLYPGERHDVQYRHWDQVLADIAFLGDRVVLAVDGATYLVAPERAEKLLAGGGATLGLAAWQS